MATNAILRKDGRTLPIVRETIPDHDDGDQMRDDTGYVHVVYRVRPETERKQFLVEERRKPNLSHPTKKDRVWKKLNFTQVEQPRK